MIKTENLYKSFGDKQVLLDANLCVEDGAVCGLVGINGAGKSTLLRILSGVMRQDSGKIEIDGQPVYNNEKIKQKIFFLPDDPYFDFNLTGEKLCALYKTFYPFDDRTFKNFSEKFSLDPNKPIRNFSKGMKRQLFISAALACTPSYLLLDEAFDGLDPLARLEFKRGLIDLQEKGGTVIIASHSLRELEDICDSFILIDNCTVKGGVNLTRALDDAVKLQIAFEREVTREELPFECVQYEKTGRIITVVVKGDYDRIEESLRPLKPIILDRLPMDFEDLFISEVNDRGYLK